MGNLQNKDYLQFLCKKYGFRPSKKYGQNFLLGAGPIEKMIEAAEVKNTDTVVEVGPGFGILTFALAEKAKKVMAFEIEKKLTPYWEEKKPGNVEIFWGNVLDYMLTTHCALREYKVVANLPYQITSPIIRVFLEAVNPPRSMTLMVQKEVAERICAKVGDMSLLSVAVQYYAEPTIIGIAPKDSFWPAPKVDSAIIHLSVRPRVGYEKEKVEKLFSLVRAGFMNKRKLLTKNLESLVGKKKKAAILEVFHQIGLKDTVRAQELGVGDWQKLTAIIDKLS